VASEPSEEETLAWRRHFAADANNAGWALVECLDRTPARTEEMLDAAHAAAHLWRVIGTDLHAARGHLLLGIAHGLAGNGALARRYSSACLEYFCQHDCPDWEIALAHAAMACAAGAAGDAGLHRTHYEEAARLGAAIADAEDRAIFMKTFEQVPKDPASAS
jgi:hypothetical protein